jgi:hypothetical protein
MNRRMEGEVKGFWGLEIGDGRLEIGGGKTRSHLSVIG